MIAIIAILFPVFAQAREKARAISCVSNMKQNSTTTMMYVQDYDETYPVHDAACDATLTPGTNNPPVTWPAGIMPYVKNRPVFHCPDDIRAKAEVSYGTNGWLGQWHGGTPIQDANQLVVTTIGAINAPANMIAW